jgi:hypothetical protein
VGSRSSRNSALASGTTRSWRPSMIVTGAAICGQQIGKRILRVPADIAHRLHEAVAVGAGEVIRVNVVRYSARDRLHCGVDDRAGIHPAILVGVEQPRLQRLTELNRTRSSAGAHNHPRNPLRVRCRREQGGRGPHVRRGDVVPRPGVGIE